MDLHRELSYGQPNGSLFFLSVPSIFYLTFTVKISALGFFCIVGHVEISGM